MTPRISIITTTFNDARHIGEAIESILSQSFEDFEYIIVNDNSQDETKDIINKYARTDRRIIPLSNERNLGRAASRNRALQISQSEWIAIFDGDDISDPLRLEKQSAFINEYPNVDYFGSDCCYENKVTLDPISKEFILHTSHETISWELYWNYPFHHSSTMGRKKILIEAGGYPETYPVCEDIYLWMQLAKIGARFANIPEKLIKYRVNPAPNHYALNQILAQKLHCQHVEYLIGEKIPPDVFEIIWSTNYSESFPADKYILSINNIFDASQILVKSFEKISSNINMTRNERKKIQANFLLRLRRVLNLISTVNCDDGAKYQSIYSGYLNTYNALHIEG